MSEMMRRLESHLFSRSDRRLLNIKFTVGVGGICKEDIVSQLVSILDQREAGLLQPRRPVHTGKPQVNVRKLVAQL